MKSVPAGVRRLAAIGATAASVLVAVYARDPDHFSRPAMAFHDFLHVLGFVGVTVVLFWGFPAAADRTAGERALRRGVLAGVALAVGIGIESWQGALGGDADPWDVARDAAGIAIASAGCVAVARSAPLVVRAAAAVVALAVLASAFAPTARALAEERRALRQFPVLADFRDPRDLDRFAWSKGSRGFPSRLPDGTPALRLSMMPGAYPGLVFAYFPRDWSGYTTFAITCVNPSESRVPITVRIDDRRHDERHEDRFNRSFTLRPGRNVIEIPLAEIAAAPQGRTLDLASVRTVIVFSADLGEPRAIDFVEFRLSK